MNYNLVYDQLITRARKRELCGYVEKHHIIPKCIEKRNNIENIVSLTAREHFICHWVLTKIYPENRKLAFAFFSMCNRHVFDKKQYRPSGLVYEIAKRHRSSLGMPDEVKEKISKSNSGRGFPCKEESRRKISEKLRGIKKKPFSLVHRENLSLSHIGLVSGNKGNHYSQDVLDKISKAHKGKHISEEQKRKISISMKLYRNRVI